jgi:hypothetical protein
MNRIKEVVPLADYRLEIKLENGNVIVLDFKSRIGTVRFGMLADKAFFDRAVTDGSYINWDNQVEISISEIFELARK